MSYLGLSIFRSCVFALLSILNSPSNSLLGEIRQPVFDLSGLHGALIDRNLADSMIRYDNKSREFLDIESFHWVRSQRNRTERILTQPILLFRGLKYFNAVYKGVRKAAIVSKNTIWKWSYHRELRRDSFQHVGNGLLLAKQDSLAAPEGINLHRSSHNLRWLQMEVGVLVI